MGITIDEFVARVRRERGPMPIEDETVYRLLDGLLQHPDRTEVAA